MHMIEVHAKAINDRTSLRFEPWPLFAAGVAALIATYLLVPGQAALAVKGALFLAPIWLPFLIVGGAISIWYTYKRSEYISQQKNILLEIKPPRNLAKTPLAMEAFLSTLHLTGGEATWFARLMGGVRPWWSLEIVSFEGKVRFFIWGRAAFRRLVESQLYAQYPGTQVVEATDYTRTITAAEPDWDLWGCDFVHTAETPLPIKTYVEYGLDKTQKEYEQIDPLSNLLEFMNAVGKGEYLWLQFIIRAHKGEIYGSKPGTNQSSRKNAAGKPYTWKDEAEEMVKKIREKTKDTYIDMVTGEERPGFPNPTKGQMEKIAAIERNVSKLAFDVGARGIYLAKPDKFHGPMIPHLIALFKPFSSEGWNGINSSGWMKKFDDYPWDWSAKKRKAHFRKELVEAYRRRQFFYDPFFEGGTPLNKVMVMSTEELATVFHIPSATSTAPGIERIQSATSEAPSNLPT